MQAEAAILFHSTNFAIWADKVLGSRGLWRKLSPVPRHLSSDCGYCVKIYQEDTQQAAALMEETGIEFQEIAPL